MPSIYDTITQQLGGANLTQLSQQIGADEATTSQAIQTALPMLLSGLARNASAPGGADALSSALSNHADSGAINNVGALLGNPQSGGGAGILGHIFGNKRDAVEQGMGTATGLGKPQMSKLLMVLAPIVMAYLARGHQQPQTADAPPSGSGELPQILEHEANEATKKAPSVIGGLIGMLDRDGDGNPLNDITRMAGGAAGLGGLLGGR
jgi:hypothetical protein